VKPPELIYPRTHVSRSVVGLPQALRERLVGVGRRQVGVDALNHRQSASFTAASPIVELYREDVAWPTLDVAA
jgi:hypothetical protein